MREQHNKVVIFSVEKESLTKFENILRTGEIAFTMRYCNVPYKILEGHYYFNKEMSFLV